MKIQVQLKWTDVYEFQQIFSWSNYTWRTVLPSVIGCSVLIIILVPMVASLGNTMGLVLLLCIIPVVLPVSFFYQRYRERPHQIEREFQQNQELSKPFEAEVSDAAVRITNDFGYQEFPYDYFIQWRETYALFVLYSRDNQVYLLPKRYFPNAEQIEWVRGNLRQHIPPHQPSIPWRVFLVAGFIFLVAVLYALYSVSLMMQRFRE